jgi:hypothetical protein
VGGVSQRGAAPSPVSRWGWGGMSVSDCAGVWVEVRVSGCGDYQAEMLDLVERLLADGGFAADDHSHHLWSLAQIHQGRASGQTLRADGRTSTREPMRQLRMVPGALSRGETTGAVGHKDERAALQRALEAAAGLKVGNWAGVEALAMLSVEAQGVPRRKVSTRAHDERRPTLPRVRGKAFLPSRRLARARQEPGLNLTP